MSGVWSVGGRRAWGLKSECGTWRGSQGWGRGRTLRLCEGPAIGKAGQGLPGRRSWETQRRPRL